MANHKSAIKRNRQNLKRRLRNRDAKSALRTAIRDVREAVLAKDHKKAQELLITAESVATRSAVKGIIHKANASRRISRLSALVATAK